MTIDEAVHRVVRGHWFLILSCVLAALVASIVWVDRQPTQYQAAGRIQMGTTLAASNVQADAMSQRAYGIATSPDVVSRALGKAHVIADPAIFATDNITVTRVGVSPVLDIAVTADSPEAATTIAQSITNDVIETSNRAAQALTAQSATARTITDARRRNLQKQISDIDEQRATLIPRLVTASPGRALAIQAQLSALTATQTEYQRQLADLEASATAAQQTASSDQQALLAQQALLLDPASAPVLPVAKGMPQQTAIAGLLGLLLGLGLASLREAISPSLRSPRAVSYALGAPHLGHIPSSDLGAPESVAALTQIGDRLTLLARGQDVERVFLVPVDDRYDVLANLVAIRLRPHTGGNDHRVDCVVLGSHWEEPGYRPAAVLLSRRTVRASELRRAMAQLEPLGWPLLGFVTCETREGGSVRHILTLTPVKTEAPRDPALPGQPVPGQPLPGQRDPAALAAPAAPAAPAAQPAASTPRP